MGGGWRCSCARARAACASWRACSEARRARVGAKGAQLRGECERGEVGALVKVHRGGAALVDALAHGEPAEAVAVSAELARVVAPREVGADALKGHVEHVEAVGKSDRS